MGSFTPYVSRRRTCVRAGIVLGNSGGVVSARLGREPQQPSPHLWLAWIAGFEVPRKKRGFRWVWANGHPQNSIEYYPLPGLSADPRLTTVIC